LHAPGRLVIANFLPEKDIWRLTVTFECIHQSLKTVVYAVGKNKAEIIKTVFTSPFRPDEYPVQRVGTEAKPALFILDRDAAGDTFNRH
jgi:6-phosphogluconolactonase